MTQHVSDTSRYYTYYYIIIVAVVSYLCILDS